MVTMQNIIKNTQITFMDPWYIIEQRKSVITDHSGIILLLYNLHVIFIIYIK